MNKRVATALSIRVGAIRLEDIVGQSGDAARVDVAVVDSTGKVQHVLLSFTENGARDVGSACFNAKFATARLASFKLWAVEVFAVVATRAQPRSRLTRTPRDGKGRMDSRTGLFG